MDSNQQTFKDWLKNNTPLLERSVNLYSRTINRFLSEYPDPSIDNINKFISESVRIKYSFYVKYAFKFFLKFLGREDDYKNIVKVKSKPTKKAGCYVSKDILESIVNGIDDPIYRTVALIQFVTGKRAHDVLGMEETNIIRLEDGALRIKFLPKGEMKEDYGFVPGNYSAVILDIVEKVGRKYPFLKGDSATIVQLIDNNYHNYEQAIKKSASKLGIPQFGSHDFKRNFLQEVYIASGKDIYMAKDLGGHSRIETTMKYFKRVQPEDTKEVIEKIRGKQNAGN